MARIVVCSDQWMLLSKNKEPGNGWCGYANTKCILHISPGASSCPPSRMASVWQAGSYSFICWCSCSIIKPDELWQEVNAASKQTGNKRPGCVSQGSHSLGWSLSYWQRVSKSYLWHDSNKTQHNTQALDTPMCMSESTEKTREREGKIKMKGCGRFCLGDVGDCEQSAWYSLWEFSKI